MWSDGTVSIPREMYTTETFSRLDDPDDVGILDLHLVLVHRRDEVVHVVRSHDETDHVRHDDATVQHAHDPAVIGDGVLRDPEEARQGPREHHDGDVPRRRTLREPHLRDNPELRQQRHGVEPVGEIVEVVLHPAAAFVSGQEGL